MNLNFLQELLLKLVEDNYPLAADPDASPGACLSKCAL